MLFRCLFTRRCFCFSGIALLLISHGSETYAAEEPLLLNAASSSQERSIADMMTQRQWKVLDRSVDRGLEFLSTQQQADGAFKSVAAGQPAVTSLCVMAFLSRGHLPNQGPYGEQISRAIDFVLSKQRPNGLLFAEQAGEARFLSIVGCYNHAIAGVMLGEVYGMTGSRNQKSVRSAIISALRFTRQEQVKRKRWPGDHGGWRYLFPIGGADSDLSITAWHLMFYRSARNAEFDVPKQQIDDALAFIERCYDARRGTFSYGLRGNHRTYYSRGMAGAGIVSLALAGKHQTEMAQRAGQFVLDHPFDRFNRGGLTKEDRFYYGAFYCSQAMLQLGGEYWERFYPTLLNTLTENQRRNGSWDLEANQDGRAGYSYSTSLAILALTPPYQLLPIYQR